MPLFHVHGLMASTLATLSTGGTVVVPAQASIRCRSGAWPGTYGVTWYSAVPTIPPAAAGARRGSDRPTTGWQREACASSARAARRCRRGDARARSGIRRAGARGVRHDGSRASDGVESAAAGGAQTRLGRPRHGRRDQHHGRARHGICRRASAAKLSSRGPNVIRGYENNPEANAASFVDGWFRTGDQGCLDADGYLTLVGADQGTDQPRRRENFAARDRRSAAGASGGRRSGLRSACRMRRGARKSPRPSSCASRSARPSCSLTASERLADFKRPKQIHITDTIPRTATGKIQRGAVAKAFTTQSQAS